MLPQISLIIPVYNAALHLNRCIDSCLKQTFFDFEIVVVNDGSTDRSSIILDKYAIIDSRIKIIHQFNQGANAARNTALSNSSGEYIFFLDADDYLPEEALQKLIDKAKEDNTDIVIGSFLFKNKRRELKFINSSPYGEDRASLLCSTLSEQGFMPSLWGKLIRKELFMDIDMVEDLSIGEDAATVYQLINRSAKVVFLKDVIYVYVLHENSCSHKLNEKSRNSLIKFGLWTFAFFENEKYFETELFRNIYAKHILGVYYRFLFEGGSPDYNISFTQQINIYFLKNKWSRIHTPFQRIFLLDAYRINPVCGKFIRFLLRQIKAICKKNSL